MQVANSGLKPDEQRRLRNRAVARWLIAAGSARLRPGWRPMAAELVVHNGRSCAAVTANDGQILALYPVSGSGERRRLYRSVPIPVGRPLPPARSPVSRADSAALLMRSRESRMASSAQISRSRAVCEAAALLCARSRDLRAGSLAHLTRAALPPV